MHQEPAVETLSTRTRLARVWWIVAGLLAVGIGAVAIVIPGLPSTVFFIFAAWCFSRSSRRLEQWLLGLPKIGPLVRDHRAGLGMPRRVKGTALLTMWAAIALSGWLLRERVVLLVVILAAGAVGTFVILWWVPTRERVLERAQLDSSNVPTL